jgi:hypothetical protein
VPSSSGALVNKQFCEVTAADVATATFCEHINATACLTAGTGTTAFDEAEKVGGD